MKAKAQRLIAAIGVTAAVLGLVACGGGGSSSGTSGSGSSATSGETSSSASSEGGAETLQIKRSKAVGETAGPNGEEPTPISALKLSPAEVQKVTAGHYTAAISWPEESAFTIAVTKGATEEFKKLGMEVVAETQAEAEPAKQQNQIETELAKKPSVMLSLPGDPESMAATYRKVGEKGTKLVLLSNLPPGFVQGKDYVTVVTDDLFEMGHQAADALAAAMGDKGKIAYFYYDASYYVTNQRDEAFKKTIEANYPEIEIVAEQGIADVTKAEEEASAVFTKNPEIEGVYSTFSTPPGEGILSALRSSGSDAKMVSLDISDPLALDMAEGGNVKALVVDEAYGLGQAMAESAAYGLIGKKIPPFLIAGALTITKENINEGYEKSLHIEPPQSVLEAEK
jgi:ribose transport system substrate-binding protein